MDLELDYFPQQVPDSFVFTTSSENPTNVKLIIRYLREFSLLAISDDWDLKVESTSNSELAVKFVQRTWFSDKQKVWKDMEELLEMKKLERGPMNEEKDSKVAEVVRKLEFPEEIEAASKRVFKTSRLAGVTDKFVLYCFRKEDRFLLQKNFEKLKPPKALNKYLCNRLTFLLDDDCDDFEPPFSHITSRETASGRKTEEVEKFLDVMLKSEEKKKIDEMQLNIMEWFRRNERQFRYYPKIDTKQKFFDDFGLENTCGTVHFIYRSNIWISLGIVDRVVVGWSFDETKEEGLKKLDHKMNLRKWPKNWKLATNLEVGDENNLFIHTSNEKVFEYNEGLITFIDNNIKNISPTGDLEKDLSFIFSFVNLFFLNIYHCEAFLYFTFSR